MHHKTEANRLIGLTDLHAIVWQKAFRLVKNLHHRVIVRYSS